MNRSRARIEASRGKSWNAVLAARIRIPAVNTCSSRNMKPPSKTVSPIWASTGSSWAMSSEMRTCSAGQSTVMPRNIVIDIAPITARVVAAFLACGRGTPGTPSAIASTPVSAVAPDENARAMRNSESVCSTSIGRSAVSATGHPPRHSTNPVTRVIPIISTNPQVGIANSEPASLTPRRLASVTSATSPTAIGTRTGTRVSGATEAIAVVPAVMLTATVRT